MRPDPGSFSSVDLPLMIAALGFGLMALATGRVGQAGTRRDEHPIVFWSLTLLLGAGGLVALLIFLAGWLPRHRLP